VSAGIYDVAGRRVRELFSETRAAGQYPITWDGRDDRGERLASGVYFACVRAAGKTYTGRVVLMRQ
jgi:hypothetical protein